MARFRKRPIEIEAVRYAGHGNLDTPGDPPGGVPEWLWEALASGVARPTNGGDPFMLYTLESPDERPLEVSPGDWIIRGIAGELYPCKPDIFESTYEAVD